MTDADAAERNTTPPATGRAGFTYGLIRFVLNPLVRGLYRPRIEGRKNVPRTGPVILASNHLSFIDSVVIPIAAPRRVHFLAKSSYFAGTGLVGRLRRRFFIAIGASEVSREAGQAALDALEQQRLMLEEGKAIALYPEGTRSLDGRLYRGRTGAAFLALTTGALVVPVGLVGTDQIMPVGARFPRLRPRATVRFGQPLDVSVHGSARSGRARRLATDDIMNAIHALTDQELAGEYNDVPG